VENKYAAAWVRIGKLDGGEALAGKVGSVASRRYVEQVERQRQSRTSNGHRLGQRHL